MRNLDPTTDDDARYERLTAEDLDLPPHDPLPLRFRPAERWSPLVISFPHVGLGWPAQLRPKPQVDARRNADYEVHRLYEHAASLGAASIHAVYSRLVVDLNRAADDVSPSIVPDHPAPRPRKIPGVVAEPDASRIDRPGRGVVWASAIGNVKILPEPLSFAAFRDRIDRYHAPYYRAIEVLLRRRVRRFGFAILLDAHSMPGSVGPDAVLGTLSGNSCAPTLESLALRALTSDPRGDADASDLDVRLNEPYRGGELVRRFGRPDAGLHALQLEVSRSLYMDEGRHVLWTLPSVPSDAAAPLDRAGASADHRGSGTEPSAPRETPPRAAARIAQRPPTARQARDLAGLVARVTCLVRSLAGLGGRNDSVDLAERSVASLRATHGRASDSFGHNDTR